MPNRNVEGNYRYKYQGQEKDPETGKEAFELRLWDSRIGRWLTTDPAGQYASPYLGMGNNPINGIDIDGGVFVRGSGITEQQFTNWKARMRKILGAARFDYLENHKVHINVHFTNSPIDGGRLNGRTIVTRNISNSVSGLGSDNVPVQDINGDYVVMTSNMSFFSRDVQFPVIKKPIGNFSETMSRLKGRVSIDEVNVTIDYTKRFDTNSHELGHVYFALKNPELDYIWGAIEDSSNWFNPNGEGHLFNNPTGIFARMFQNLTPKTDAVKILSPRDF